jgi:hypothetical protein
MYIYIDDKNFWLDSGCFPEKITRLKQINPVKFKINLYIDPINVDRLRNTDLEISNQLDFLKSLKKYQRQFTYQNLIIIGGALMVVN